MKISREFAFEASHILPKHPGKCSRLHGHSFRLLVEVWGVVSTDTGFVMDYKELKDIVQPIVDRFDHQHLNAFVRYPSSENIAIHVAHILRTQFQGLDGCGLSRFRVSVSETQNTWSIWDSASRYCTSIFDQNVLDSAEDKMDAGWRSPEFSKLQFILAMDEAQLQAYADHEFKDWEVAQSELAQRRLYNETLGKQGEIFEELKAATHDPQR